MIQKTRRYRLFKKPQVLLAPNKFKLMTRRRYDDTKFGNGSTARIKKPLI